MFFFFSFSFIDQEIEFSFIMSRLEKDSLTRIENKKWDTGIKGIKSNLLGFKRIQAGYESD
jgi:hypothetical protein